MGPEASLLFALSIFTNAAEWEWQHYAIWCGGIILGYEVLSALSFLVAWSWPGDVKTIPVRGRHQDKLEMKDLAFITFARCTSVPFAYQLLNYAWKSGQTDRHVEWGWDEVTVLNTLVALPALFLVYDFFYHLFHWALHFRAIYGLVHKHHHQQMAPSRGNKDAINVHPFEFFVGEYLHWFAVYLIPCHIITVTAFILIGGVAASLNHTRYDIQVPWLQFGVRYHDQHHVIPNCNYSQYTVVWDKVWGTYLPHPGMHVKGRKLVQ